MQILNKVFAIFVYTSDFFTVLTKLEPRYVEQIISTRHTWQHHT